MSSSDPERLFAVRSDPAVTITIYDSRRAIRCQGEGRLELPLPSGLYQVHLERGGLVKTEIVAHTDPRGTTFELAGPPLRSPAPLAAASTSQAAHVEAARRLSTADTAPPLGPPPHTARLFVMVRLRASSAPPSEPLSIHDASGRQLTAILVAGTEHPGYATLSCRAAPGTYRLHGARRHFAITIPEDRAAHVFVTDPGELRLDDVRVALVASTAAFDPTSPIALAMESVLDAMRTGRPLPAVARDLLPDAATVDLSFGIAAAHLLWRSGERDVLEAVMRRLVEYRALPDVEILECAMERLGAPAPRLEAPPLFRASLLAALTGPRFPVDDVSPIGAFAQAARTCRHDSVWCTWSARPWDERWIEPSIEALYTQDISLDAGAIARSLALPPAVVGPALRALDELPGPFDVPGYALHEVVGHGPRSTVFRAIKLLTKEQVAVKVVRGAPPPSADSRLAALAQRDELVLPRASGALAAGGAWCELELCRGNVLELLPDEDTPLAATAARKILREALAGLALLHGAGVVHGGLKPENLLVRRDGSIALADAGAATPPSLAPRFAAPELLLGDPVAPSPAADVWSIAATCYFLVTLEPPRDERAGQTRLEAARANAIIPLADRRADLPASLVRPIDEALDVEASRRPADGAALRERISPRKLSPPGGPNKRAAVPATVLEPRARDRFTCPELVGTSRAFSSLIEAAAKAAAHDRAVSITGPTGTGKHALARAIHNNSARRDQPFVRLDCTAASDELPRLLGLARGSLMFPGLETGEMRDGTLFLDEVGGLPPAIQQRLESHVAIRRGPRIIASTSTSLRDRVAARMFRPGLLERLQACELAVPGLDERREDIAPLVAHFAEVSCRRWELAAIDVDPSAIAACHVATWTGHIAQLGAAVTEGVVRAAAESSPRVLEHHVFPEVEPARVMPLEEAMRVYQARFVRLTLERCEWVPARAAKELDVSRKQMLHLISSLGISRGDK